ncbi:MAG: YlmC/YmxH family sporulation protein [Clostridia bacterium]|nr:YlmC/YmxH family sporulation protein [Clostridia bacterium]
MELSFSELRAKEVINMQDGRKLGRVCDLVLCYPENRWLGIVVPSGKGFGKKNDLFIELRNIAKIGEDVILVNIGLPRKPSGGKRTHGTQSPPAPPYAQPYAQSYGQPQDGFGGGRNYEEFE